MERWNPFRDMEAMRQAMDRWFDDRLPVNFMSSGNQSLSIAIDMHETENGYELIASLPGVKSEDLDITINRDTLTIRGKSGISSERQQGNYIYRERHSGSFNRTVRLPEPVDSEKVEASLDHGVLKLTLPRLQQTGQRRIQVNSGKNSTILGQDGPNVGESGMRGGGVLHGSEAMSGNQGDSSAHETSTTNGSQVQSGQSVTIPNAGPSQPSSTKSVVGTAGLHFGQNQSAGQQAQNSGEYGALNNSGSSGASLDRPEALNNLGATQFDSLNQHVSVNDENGFKSLAGSYGWDNQTVSHVWQYLNRHASPEEARRAFEQEGQSGQSQQQPGSSR